MSLQTNCIGLVHLTLPVLFVMKNSSLNVFREMCVCYMYQYLVIGKVAEDDDGVIGHANYLIDF